MSNGILTMVATSGCVVIFGIETLLMAILGVDPRKISSMRTTAKDIKKFKNYT